MIISDGRKIKVYNGTVDTISANKVVIVKGKQIILASNTDINATRYPLGYTLSSINTGEYGEILLEGSIQNINSSSYGFQGTILYLSTSGNITTTRPSTAIVIGTTMTNDLVSGSIYFKSILDNKVPYTGATNNVDLGEYELKAGQIEFDQTPTGTAGVGIMRWNDADGTVDLGMKGGSVTLQIGQEQLTRIVNKTEIDLLEVNYQAVRISGALGNRLKVDLAQADSDANSAETLGIVTETILKNNEGFITTSGLVRNIDTTGTLQGETWLDGDMLYLSGTVAGQLTNVKPSAPTHTVIMGYVVRAHGTQGQIYVKVDNGYEIDELHNVRIIDPRAEQILIYDADTSIWRNSDIPPATVNWGPIGGILSDQSDLQTELDNKQNTLTLTTTGNSGPATLVGSTLNIPQYSGGSGVSKSFLTGSHQASTVALGATYYNGFVTGNFVTSSNVEYQRRSLLPLACTLSNFTVNMGACSGAGSVVFTLRKNAVDTAVVITVVCPSVSGIFSAVGTLSCVANDIIGYKVFNSTTAVTGIIPLSSIVIEI